VLFVNVRNKEVTDRLCDTRLSAVGDIYTCATKRSPSRVLCKPERISLNNGIVNALASGGRQSRPQRVSSYSEAACAEAHRLRT
jgi:hypothetical protein